MTEADALEVLRAIDDGRIPVSSPVYAIESVLVEYRTPDGFRVRVFDDCGDWDYVDSWAPPGGEFVDAENGDLFNFYPSKDTLGSIWKWGDSIAYAPEDPRNEELPSELRSRAKPPEDPGK